MFRKKQVHRGEKVPLKLTATERSLLLRDQFCPYPSIEAVIRETPARAAVMLTLGDLQLLVGFVAGEANHCADDEQAETLDSIFQKLESLLHEFTADDPAR